MFARSLQLKERYLDLSFRPTLNALSPQIWKDHPHDATETNHPNKFILVLTKNQKVFLYLKMAHARGTGHRHALIQHTNEHIIKYSKTYQREIYNANFGTMQQV